MAISPFSRAIACIFFLTHIPATVLMDSQAILPASVVPGFAKAGPYTSLLVTFAAQLQL